MSNQKLFTVLLIALVGSFLTFGCVASKAPLKTKQGNVTQGDADTLVAVKTDQAPNLDGTTDEVWNKAQEIKIDLKKASELQGGTGGKFDNGQTTVGIKALYDNERIYLRYEWADPTESSARGPWILEGGKLVKKPYDTHYEDKLATFWNINDSTANFNQVSGIDTGCTVTCHKTDFKDEKTNKDIRKHYTNGPNEKLDIWHWKLTRQNSLFGPDKPGLMHDQYMDDKKFDPKDEKSKGAGRHSDPSEPPKEYTDNATGTKPDWGQPKLVFDGEPVNGSKYVIVEGLDKTKPFEPEMIKTMKEGDTIPGPIAAQIKGDGADIPGKGKYENGKWVLEVSRKLKTSSQLDVQFDDLTKAYWFGVSAFDNSQIGHAYHNAAKKLIFK